MAFINAEKVRIIRNNLKEAFPSFKFSVRKDGYSAVFVTVLKAPVEFVENQDQKQLNHYHLGNYNHSRLLEIILKIVNFENYDNSQPEYDYFDVGYYVRLEQGKFDKPFVYNEVSEEKLKDVYETAEQFLTRFQLTHC